VANLGLPVLLQVAVGTQAHKIPQRIIPRRHVSRPFHYRQLSLEQLEINPPFRLVWWKCLALRVAAKEFCGHFPIKGVAEHNSPRGGFDGPCNPNSPALTFLPNPRFLPLLLSSNQAPNS
jgi:hypothetical protein